MGIWLELGIFVVVIAFGLWQLHDVRQARERTRQEKAQRARQEAGRSDAQGPADSAD